MSPLRLNGSTSGAVTLDCPAVGGNNTLVLPTGNGSAHQVLKNGATAGSLAFGLALPSGNGTNGQVLTTDGAGGSSWANAGLSSTAVIGSTAQTWTNVLGSRTNGTTYTNSTGRPIMVILAGNDNANQGLNYTFQVQGSNIGVALPNVAVGYSMIIGVHIVPDGQTYRASWNGAANISQWWELR